MLYVLIIWKKNRNQFHVCLKQTLAFIFLSYTTFTLENCFASKDSEAVRRRSFVKRIEIGRLEILSYNYDRVFSSVFLFAHISVHAWRKTYWRPKQNY